MSIVVNKDKIKIRKSSKSNFNFVLCDAKKGALKSVTKCHVCGKNNNMDFGIGPLLF